MRSLKEIDDKITKLVKELKEHPEYQELTRTSIIAQTIALQWVLGGDRQ
jgi:hypothetical protein